VSAAGERKRADTCWLAGWPALAGFWVFPIFLAVIMNGGVGVCSALAPAGRGMPKNKRAGRISDVTQSDGKKSVEEEEEEEETP